MRRRLLALALLSLLAGCAVRSAPARAGGGPVLTTAGDRFLLDGRPFRMWGTRVASATQTDSLVEHLVAQLDDYRAHGVNTLSVYYMGSRGRNSDPFSPDGTRIDPAHERRMARLLEAAAERGMVVVVGIFYQHAPFGLRDAGAVREAVRAVTRSLRPYRHLVVNIANEQNSYGWEDSAPVFDFRDPERIVELARLVREEDPARLVGGGGYDHEKNLAIGRSPAIDVLLFDTDRPEPNSGLLFDRFVAGGVTGKPIVNVELFGGWTGRFERGVFPDSVRRAYFTEVDAAAARPGLSVFFHNNPWHQHPTEPLRFDLGGAGTPQSPGIRWYYEYVKRRRAATEPG